MKKEVNLSFENDTNPLEYLIKSMKGGDDRYIMDMIYDLTVKLVEEIPSISQCEKPHQHAMIREILNHRIMDFYNIFVHCEDKE